MSTKDLVSISKSFTIDHKVVTLHWSQFRNAQTANDNVEDHMHHQKDHHGPMRKS